MWGKEGWNQVETTKNSSNFTALRVITINPKIDTPTGIGNIGVHHSNFIRNFTLQFIVQRLILVDTLA